MDEKKYRVRFYKDGLYEVLEFVDDDCGYERTGFMGSLADCEAWIRLHEQGYMI